MVEFTAIPGVTKLAEYVATGLGAIAGPLLANWQASKYGKAKLTEAHYNAEIKQIEANAEASSLLINAKAQVEAKNVLVSAEEQGYVAVEISTDTIAQSMMFQTRKRLANAGAIVEHAAEELKDEKVVDQEVEPDWAARFFAFAQDVSNQQMQQLWGELLAGEVKKPGSFSLRTLDTLRNLTSDDAKLFARMSNYVLNNEFIFYGSFRRTNWSILHVTDFMSLADSGLVFDTEAGYVRGYEGKPSANPLFWCMYGSTNLFLVRAHATDDWINIPAKYLTQAGRELLPIVRGVPVVKLAYLKDMGEYVQAVGWNAFYEEDGAKHDCASIPPRVFIH